LKFGELTPDVGSPLLKLVVKELDVNEDLSSFASSIFKSSLIYSNSPCTFLFG
jgi:hypothetical protein